MERGPPVAEHRILREQQGRAAMVSELSEINGQAIGAFGVGDENSSPSSLGSELGQVRQCYQADRPTRSAPDRSLQQPKLEGVL